MSALTEELARLAGAVDEWEHDTRTPNDVAVAEAARRVLDLATEEEIAREFPTKRSAVDVFTTCATLVVSGLIAGVVLAPLVWLVVHVLRWAIR